MRGIKEMSDNNLPSYTNTFNAPGVYVVGDLSIGANAVITADGGNSGPTQGVPILIPNSGTQQRTLTINGSPSIKNSHGESLYPLYMDQRQNNDSNTINQRANDYFLANELRAYRLSIQNVTMMHMFVPAGHYNAARPERFGNGSAANNPSAKTFEVQAQYSPVNTYAFKLASANNPSTVDAADIAPAATGITLKDDSGNVLDAGNYLDLAVREKKRIIPVLTGTGDFDRIVIGGFSTYNDTMANVFSYDQGYITGLGYGSVKSGEYGTSLYETRPGVSGSPSAGTQIVVDGIIPIISIDTQPQNVSMAPGTYGRTLSVTASVDPANTPLTYQWYSNTTDNNSGGTAIPDATNATFTIPTTLTAGSHYYFCEVIASGAIAVAVRSDVATVTTTPEEAEPDGITWALLSPSGSSISLDSVLDDVRESPDNKSITATVKDGTATGAYTLRATAPRAGGGTLSASAVFEVHEPFDNNNNDLHLLEGSITVNPAREDGVALPFAITDITDASLGLIQPGTAVRLLDVSGNPLTETVKKIPARLEAQLLDMQTIEVKAIQGATNASIKNVTAEIVNTNGANIPLAGTLTVSIRSWRSKISFSTNVSLNAFFSADDWVNVNDTLADSGIGFQPNEDNSITLFVNGTMEPGSRTVAFNAFSTPGEGEAPGRSRRTAASATSRWPSPRHRPAPGHELPRPPSTYTATGPR